MAKEKKKVADVIDCKTGEVLNEIYAGDRIFHPVEQDQIKNYNKDRAFVKLFDGIGKLRKIINNNGALLTCLSLADYVCYNDCVLRNQGLQNGRILDIHDLSELLDIPYNTLRKQIALLMKLGILAYAVTGNVNNGHHDTETILAKTIVVNPDVYMRGKNVNKTVIALFEKSGWKELKDQD